MKIKVGYFGDVPPGVVSVMVYGSGQPGSGTEVPCRMRCDYCDEDMMLAWGDNCPICENSMRRVMPGGAFVVI